MISGIGIDVVEIQRVNEMIQRYGNRFIKKIFTESEIEYALSKASSPHHFAGRFAVKEAVSKAISTGWSGGFRWKDVEVTNDDSGKPSVQLHGHVKELLQGSTVFVSISHSENVIAAVAIIEKRI
ncbi:MAG: holo-ACP synthase [Ignavibacteriae bacterium]|nr:holo-ACP synthase [Ignavibacteriota bacterium]